MPKVRPAWLILIAVIAITAAVPVLRQHARLQWVCLPDLPRLPTGDVFEDLVRSLRSPQLERLGEWSQPYAERSLDLVRQQHPDDPDMLLGTAHLADDEHRLPLLKRAVEAGGGAAAWAAYCDALCAAGPSYERLGTWLVDPTDPVAVAEAEREIAASGQPRRLQLDAVAPILDALHSWQASDPDNGLPHALEAWYLYGLHRDDEALSSWTEAAQRPLVALHVARRAQAGAHGLILAGMPAPEALWCSWGGNSALFAKLRSCARIAVYEGMLAVMEDRPDDALRWWQASLAFAQHTEESAETTIGFLVAAAVHGIAGSPFWPWCSDGTTGIPDGPFWNGRLFYGQYHDLYVRHVGDEADADTRDRLVRSKLRTEMILESGYAGSATTGYTRANHFLGFGQPVAALALFCLLLSAALATWGRRKADQATQIHRLWVLIVGALVLLPIIECARALAEPPHELQLTAIAFPTESFFIPLGISILAALFAPLLAAVFSRAPGAGLLSVWSGNLRRILPTTVALAALLYLGLSLAAIKPRADYARHWMKPGVSEMDSVKQTLGDEWTHPTIPPDSYRAEYPPEPTPQSP